MKNKKSKVFYHILFANDLANDENEWRPYFDNLAKHYIEAFSSNIDIFQNLIDQLMVNKNSLKDSVKNEIIYKELVDYYQAYAALSPQPDGSFQINEEIMDKFKPITNKTQIGKVDLGLKDYELMGEKFTVKQLMNIVLNFYKDSMIRQQFFKKILSEPKEKIDKVTLSDITPSSIMLQNNFNGRLSA